MAIMLTHSYTNSVKEEESLEAAQKLVGKHILVIARLHIAL